MPAAIGAAIFALAGTAGVAAGATAIAGTTPAVVLNAVPLR